MSDLFKDPSYKEPEYKEHYILQNPVNIYGMFFPAGTDPFYNDALLPSYAVHFMVIRNNPQYFKLKQQ